ncbi:hypothetical protein [Roseibium sediminicola]|uniref:DUF1127 domain-containing protein n=1 Tax=Roseibium sediminicola TaxID=2933272 RepID=A0ABT0H1T9_9HYPH|nr:hypothetical protein [Roseibium sp. CAU 1639]MCK7615653.1 hypothetical protein [Roseibium sp. CAU 1639]
MPRRQPPPLFLVPAPAEPRGLRSWTSILKILLRRKPALRAIPDDLLADVLADNGLRAREQIRRRPEISGLWE